MNIKMMPIHACPECGEEKGVRHYINKGIQNKGIDYKISIRSKGFFKNKKRYMEIFYTCFTCGHKWQTDPVEVLV